MTPLRKVRLKLSMDIGTDDDLAFRLIRALVTRCGATISKCRPRAFLALLHDKRPTANRAINNEIDRNLIEATMLTPKVTTKLASVVEREMPLAGGGD